MQAFVEKLAPWIIVLGAVPAIVVLAKKLASPGGLSG
jgi:hypothetical protein